MSLCEHGETMIALCMVMNVAPVGVQESGDITQCE